VVSSKKKEKMAPEIKKGPKGTFDFKLFFLKIIKKIPKIAPAKKAKNRATIFFCQPKKSPKKTESLKSPKPIRFSFDINTKNKKKREGKRERKRE
jgi:hypothetical protein